MTILLGLILLCLITGFYWFVWQHSRNTQKYNHHDLKFSPQLSWSDHFVILGIVLYVYVSYYFYLKHLYVVNFNQIQDNLKQIQKVYSDCFSSYSCIDCAVISATFSFLFYILLTYIISGLRALEEFDSNFFEKLARYFIAVYSGGGPSFIQLVFSYKYISSNNYINYNMSTIFLLFVIGFVILLAIWYIFSHSLFKRDDLVILILDDVSLIAVLLLAALLYKKLSKVFAIKEPFRVDGEYTLWFACLVLVAFSGLIYYNYATKVITKRIFFFMENIFD